MKAENDLKILRHSAAHLLAHAVSELFPETKLTIGPATEEGFFYDCLPTRNFRDEDLATIEARMHILSKKNIPLEHKEISKKEARELYKNNPFKLELIDAIPGETVGLAIQGDFYDLCRGGHVASTGDIKHFKLLAISGSYWRADRNGQPLQCISGTAFFTAQEMADYEQHREDLLKYDHRRLGKQLDLFSFHLEAPGFPFFHPKGKTILNIMMRYMRSMLGKEDYKEISTPIMLDAELWKQSGHYAYYKDNMYFSTVDTQEFAIKPMNCPGAILIYRERPRSYRDLPLRLAEFGLVHRHELSGALHGLMRVREFTQDDAHIFCTPQQIESEVIKMIQLTYTVFHKFGFEDIKVALSTRPKKSMGSDELWEIATKSLHTALSQANLPFSINEGDGAFYGPKIDIHIKDSMGREWQCGTIQVDFFLPENFDLSYVASSGQKERPVMLHRTLYGSLERFFGILIEHYKGAFPFWLAPVQARVLTITDDQKEYARELVAQLADHKLRIEMDESSDPLAGKIKNAQLEKIPWMFVVGKKEVENKTITLRHNDGKQEFGLTLETLLAKARDAQK